MTIPVVKPHTWYEGRGTHYAFVYPAADGEGNVSAVAMTTVGRLEIRNVTPARLRPWLEQACTADMEWTSKESPARTPRVGHIYFIADEDSYIKIGYTSHSPEKRLAGLQTGHRQELRILACIRGDKAAESELHERFASARVRGEWFEPTPELLAFVDAQPEAVTGVAA